MATKKRAKWSQQKREFAAGLDALGSEDAFVREKERRARLAEKNKTALREKACTSKNRYASRKEAEETITALGVHGVKGLSVYPCEYCGGWHLTSHPWD